MKYRNEKNKIVALKSGDTAALRGIILEGCQKLYVYASAVCREHHHEMVLMTEIYVEMWQTRDMLDPEDHIDRALKRIMYRMICESHHNGEDPVRSWIAPGKNNVSSWDRYEPVLLSGLLTELELFDNNRAIMPEHRWRCPPGFSSALVRNVMRRIAA